MPSSIDPSTFFHVLDKCPHCQTRQIAASFGGASPEDGKNISFWICPKCHHGVCIESIYFNTVERDPISGIIDSYPRPASPDAPDFTPDLIAADFREAKDNLLRGNFKSAAMMARSVLEQVMKDFGANNGKLYQKIDSLAQNHKITKDMAEWAHSIRDIGNDAVHESVPVEEIDAEQAVSFAEMLLTYLYTLPAVVKQRRKTPA